MEEYDPEDTWQDEEYFGSYGTLVLLSKSPLQLAVLLVFREGCRPPHWPSSPEVFIAQLCHCEAKTAMHRTWPEHALVAVDLFMKT
jgi:hypothetical protein